ncbi:hypothetical protein [Chamaesiphon sp. OTE_8_metabat_110]|nr:hypothetical protein [Chamaesiphon sp. OTE_8_metabat_110]
MNHFGTPEYDCGLILMDISARSPANYIIICQTGKPLDFLQELAVRL